MKRPYWMYVLSLLLFGSNGIVANSISLSSYQVVLVRTLIGSITLMTLFAVTRQPVTFHKKRRDLAYLSLSGVALGASWLFLFEAYRQIGVSLATLAYYCGPIIVMALSLVLLNENLTAGKMAGFIVVLSGMLLINYEGLQQGAMGWELFCAGMSAVMYAVMILLNRNVQGITGLESPMLQLLFSLLTVALYVGLKQGLLFHIPGDDWLPILILGIVNTGFGCFIYFSTISCLPVPTVAISGYLEPLSAVLLSVVFLKESMLPIQILGAVLIMAGALLAEQPRLTRKSIRSVRVGRQSVVNRSTP